MVWTGTATGTIECVDVAIFAAYMLTFVSDRWCKASHEHRSISRSPSMVRSFRSTCIQHHIRHLISSSLQVIEIRRACGRHRVHQFSALNGRSQPDLHCRWVGAFASLRSRDVAQVVIHNQPIIFYRIHTWNVILAGRSKTILRLWLLLYKPDRATGDSTSIDK